MSIFESLSDVRVLDLTLNLAGPTGSMILGDLGADVIKVEHPERGDDTRQFRPAWDDESVVFLACNRNKRGITLDLKNPDDSRTALALAHSADVVLESFRPGTAEKLGLGYEDIRAKNPGIVYCSVSAFGRTPAGRGLPGYDPLIQAFTGIMAATGNPGEPPVRVAASLIDLSTGMWAAIGVLAALNERMRTGLGQNVEATLVDSGFALMCHQIAGFLATGDVPKPLGSASPITTPYEAFEVKDGWVMIAAGNQSLFTRLCETLGLSHLVEDPRFCTAAQRTANRYELHDEIERVLADDTIAGWMARIGGAGVPIGPVNDVSEAVRHPIAAERQLLLQADTPGIPADLKLVRLPLTSGGEPAQSMKRPPGLGEHNDEILGDLGNGGDGWTASGLGSSRTTQFAGGR